MRYMLLMLASPDGEAEPDHSVPESDEPCWMPWYQEMIARDVVLVDGAQLQPATTATTVAVADGETLLSDGPFAETKEQIAGYCVLECADLAEAIEVSSRHPTVRYGTFELRPYWD
jgi:hypothetical protein